MIEKKLTIKNIPAIITLPDQNVSYEKIPAVLLLHGFGSQKNEVGDFYSRLSTKLAEFGILSLRIDFSGYGESAVSAEKSSLHTMLVDAESAFQFLLSQPEVDQSKVGIIGFSLGACIATHLTANHSQEIKSLILLSPVGNPKKDIDASVLHISSDELLKSDSNLFDFDLGWRKIELSREFFMSLAAFDPLELIKKYQHHLLLICGNKDFSFKYIPFFIENCGATDDNKNAVILDDTDHIFNQFTPHDKSGEVIEHIAEELKSTLMNIDEPGDSSLNAFSLNA